MAAVYIDELDSKSQEMMHIARATRRTMNSRENSQPIVESMTFKIENAIALDSAPNSKLRTDARIEAPVAAKTDSSPTNSETRLKRERTLQNSMLKQQPENLRLPLKGKRSVLIARGSGGHVCSEGQKPEINNTKIVNQEPVTLHRASEPEYDDVSVEHQLAASIIQNGVIFNDMLVNPREDSAPGVEADEDSADGSYICAFIHG